MASRMPDVCGETVNENVSPPKRSKKEDRRARLKEWQAEHGRARDPLLPWQRPFQRKDLATKRDQSTAVEKTAARKPFSVRQENASASPKVNCNWSAVTDFRRASSRVEKNEVAAVEKLSQSVQQSLGDAASVEYNALKASGTQQVQSLNEQLEKLPKGVQESLGDAASVEYNALKASGTQQVQSLNEQLKKLPKGFNVAQWRAARRAESAEKLREQENKLRQTLAANRQPSQALAVANKRTVTMKPLNSISVDGPKPAINKTTFKVPANNVASTKKKQQLSTTTNVKPTIRPFLRKNANPSCVSGPTSSGKPSLVGITSRIDTGLAAKLKTETSKPSTSIASVSKRPSGVAPKLKRLATKSPVSKVGYYCTKPSPPSSVKKPSPKPAVKSKVNSRKSFKPVAHSRTTRRSTLLKAIPSVKPTNPNPKPSTVHPPSKPNGPVPKKPSAPAARRSGISLTALHRKGGERLVKAKEGLVRHVNMNVREPKDEDKNTKTTAPDLLIMSAKKDRSVSFYVPAVGVSCTPDETQRRDRLEAYLHSKGRSASSFRHCRGFSDKATPDMPKSVRRRHPTPGAPKLEIDSPAVLNIPIDDRRFTIDIMSPLSPEAPETQAENQRLTDFTAPPPLNWDQSPESKASPSLGPSLQPDIPRVMVNPPNKGSAPASPAFGSEELYTTLSALADSLHEGRSYMDVTERLDELCEASPQVQKIAKYWLCRAEVAKQAGHDNEVMRLLQLAFDHGAEPLSVLRDAYNAIHKAEVATPSRRTPRRRRHESEGDVCESSVIKFKVVAPSARKSLAGNVLPCTPVRRSVRLANAKSQKHSSEVNCVDNIEELPKSIRKSVVYKPNEALSSWDITLEYVKSTDISTPRIED